MGFAIKVNDGGLDDIDAWEADFEADEVIAISVQSAGGEVARIQVMNTSPGIRLEIVRRSEGDSMYLDMEELKTLRERGEKREKDNADRVTEGRAEMAKAEEAAASEAETEAEVPASKSKKSSSKEGAEVFS